MPAGDAVPTGHSYSKLRLSRPCAFLSQCDQRNGGSFIFSATQAASEIKTYIKPSFSVVLLAQTLLTWPPHGAKVQAFI
jgi:hypothetical protein